jgi:hypothetical protein
VSGTVYLSRVALERIEAAQAVIDQHVLHAVSGRCFLCGEESPCRSQQEASAVLLGYGRLPRRRAGATRTGEVGRREDRFGWLG